MKLYEKKLLICAFSILLIFVCGCTFILSFMIPSSAVISENDSAQNILPNGCRWLFAIKESKSDSVMENKSEKIGKGNPNNSSTVYMCGILPVKNIDISVMKNKDVFLGGQCIGIKLKTDGVLVVGIEDELRTKNGFAVSPGKECGIRVGDMIKTVNGTAVSNANELADIIQASDSQITIVGTRSKKEMIWKCNSITDSDGNKKIGIWVRGSIAGIGTVTFYDGKNFGALGHPISDIDSGNEVQDNGGSICNAAIAGIDKSKSGTPGSIKGLFMGDDTGTIIKNTPYGIYGAYKDEKNMNKAIPVAPRSEVRSGNAKIYCDLGEGVKPYEVKIDRILQSGDETKSMIISITDKKLIEKTGGIVRGMSGAPIVQNEKLIGAVTHVFVNEPTKGYAIFADRMLMQIK